jgi:hypothetical protein
MILHQLPDFGIYRHWLPELSKRIIACSVGALSIGDLVYLQAE